MALEVIQNLKDKFKVLAIAANRNTELLEKQVAEIEPDFAVMVDDQQCRLLQSSAGVQVECGKKSLIEIATHPDVDTVIVAMTGTTTVEAVIEALKAGKKVALATKEVLVGFGDFVIKAAKEGRGEILPIDSEHNALHQCLDGKDMSTVKRLILTASGGPFRQKDYVGVGPKDVLNHPTWNMGQRITVDSATLMNKGFEVIEAHYLFGVPAEKIEVLVHPQSIVHSLVEFCDGSVLAQLAEPDMRLPIEYALLYPDRGPAMIPALDLAGVGTLEFSAPDTERFPCLNLAYKALSARGTAPAVIQAADHEAVRQFLAGNLAFERIPEIISSALDTHQYIQNPTLDQVRQAEQKAIELVKQGV